MVRSLVFLLTEPNLALLHGMLEMYILSLYIMEQGHG